MKPVQKYSLVVLSVTLYKVALTFVNADEVLKCDHSSCDLSLLVNFFSEMRAGTYLLRPMQAKHLGKINISKRLNG